MTTFQPPAARKESLSLLLGGLGFLICAGIALAVLSRQSAIFGRGSVGELAASAAFFAGLAGFVVAMRVGGLRDRPWLARLPWPRRLLDLVGLAIVHGVFAFYAATAIFAVFGGAFRGLDLDRYAGAFVVGLAGAVCAYSCAASAMNLTTASLSVLVGLFLVAGSLASALGSSDAQWWQKHFSALGAAADRSGIAFNFTLICTGLVLVTLADFLTHDLTRWAQRHAEPHWRVTLVRCLLIALGVLLGMVGVIPVNRSLLWHNLVTYAAIAVFVCLLVAVPVLFRSLPGGFLAVTLIVVGLILGIVWLYLGVGYLNITAFEMGAVSTVFVWLVLFIRTVTAAVADLTDTRDEPGSVAGHGKLDP